MYHGYILYTNEIIFHKFSGIITTGEKEKRTSKKNVDGSTKSSHDNKKF